MEEGPEFYADERKVNAYRARRHAPESPNESLEKPIFMELLGGAGAKRILDLGCGDGQFGLGLLEAGCRHYTGVEAALPMVRAAQQALHGRAAEIIHQQIEAYAFPQARFDLVISRLALHYVATLGDTFRDVYATLVSGGRFVFSMVHPVITSCDRSREGGGARQDWIVDDYFVTGPRQVYFMGEHIVQYHRTVEDIYTALLDAGFVVEQLRESRPRLAQFADSTLYERRRRIPLFLFLAARKG